jgi:hypothetical protein
MAEDARTGQVNDNDDYLRIENQALREYVGQLKDEQTRASQCITKLALHEDVSESEIMDRILEDE